MAPPTRKSLVDKATKNMDPVAALVYRAIDVVKQKAAKRGRNKRCKDKHGAKYNAARKESDKEYYKKNRKRIRSVQAVYREKNKVVINAYNTIYDRERRQTDKAYNMACRVRSRFTNFMNQKGKFKAMATFSLVGCSRNEFLDYLESLDGPEKYQLDHIFPLSTYIVNDQTQFQMMHFSNFQKLTALENIKKSGRLPTKAMAVKVERWAWPDGITVDMLPDKYDDWDTATRM
tara:strand:+ start:217 stop:912 length:696 start_codon:yes stop_codon:yes gene_type:complete